MTPHHIFWYSLVEEKSETNASTEDQSEPGLYEIRIKGHLDDRWSDWFGGLAITLEDNGDTLLTGPVVDQAALHGLLKKVRDLGIPLVSVTPVETGQASTRDVSHQRGNASVFHKPNWLKRGGKK